jgi:hypothetical protein
MRAPVFVSVPTPREPVGLGLEPPPCRMGIPALKCSGLAGLADI